MTDQFSHYKIIAPVGAGGMGEVYRARDTQLDRDVALKILPDAFAADHERLTRFEREARLLASLNHPNIASIYSIAREGERSALALEFVEGEDLGQRLSRGAIPIDETLDIAGQIAAAFESAHDQGIIHRDLKPANVKVTPDGTVKVLDFGLAKALEPGGDAHSDPGISQSPTIMGTATQGGVILGTAAYMSPEQARGMKLDKRSDIFSFGALLYEMLTGARAFHGDTVSDTLASILKEDPDRSKLPANTPPAIRLLLDRCFEKDAKKRLRDMGEARLIIDEVRGGDASATTVLGAAPVSGGAVRAESSRQSWFRQYGGWIVAAVVIVAAGFMMIRGGAHEPERTPTVRKLTVPIDGESNLRYSHGGAVISPDGLRIAYINQRKLYVRRLDSWEPIEVQQTEGAANPFWSPDSDWLAYTIGKDLWKVRRDGTLRTLICTAAVSFSRVSGGAWLVDDRIVYRGKSDLMAVPASGGSPSAFVIADSSNAVDFHDPIALPGGRGLVTAVHRQQGIDTIGLVSLDGTLNEVWRIEEGDLSHPCYSPSGHLLVINDTDLWAVRFSLESQAITGDPFSVVRDAAVPSVSNDGTLVYVRDAGRINRRFVLVDRGGDIVGSLGQPADLWASYALSPDGRRAVGMESNQSDLWLHDDRRAVTRISSTGVEHDMPSFSADGKMVYFATGIEEAYVIARKLVDRDDVEEVVVPPGDMGPHYYGACPAVTADGKVLFYTATGKDRKQDIAWVNLSSDPDPQLFLGGAAREYAARPSPSDSKYVAYVSDESGTDQVYLTTWPDADRKLAVSIDGGNWPRWKGDGSELYFAQADEIFVVDVTYDPLQLGEPRKLFSRPEYDDRQPFGWPAIFDVSLDGERFLMTELVVDPTLRPRIAVVENWSAALDQ
jgi:Tol biopolymer transport system component